MAPGLKIIHTSGSLLPFSLPHPSNQARTPASSVDVALVIGTQSQLQRPRPGKAGGSSTLVGPQERKAHNSVMVQTAFLAAKAYSLRK